MHQGAGRLKGTESEKNSITSSADKCFLHVLYFALKGWPGMKQPEIDRNKIYSSSEIIKILEADGWQLHGARLKRGDYCLSVFFLWRPKCRKHRKRCRAALNLRKSR